MQREYPVQPILGVASVTFDEQNRLLLVRRAKEPAKGVWSIPGGVLELGETLHDAVTREVLEETGIRVQPFHLITNVERILHDQEDRLQYHYVIAEYLCLGDEGVPSPADDVDRALWVPLSELSNYPIPKITREIIHAGWRHFKKRSHGFDEFLNAWEV